MQRGISEKFTALEGEDFVDDKVSLEARCGDRDHGSTVFLGTHRAASSSFGCEDAPLATSSAWSRSARISRMSSMPTDKRTISAVTPVAPCSSALNCWCVVDAG